MMCSSASWPLQARRLLIPPTYLPGDKGSEEGLGIKVGVV